MFSIKKYCDSFRINISVIYVKYISVLIAILRYDLGMHLNCIDTY